MGRLLYINVADAASLANASCYIEEHQGSGSIRLNIEVQTHQSDINKNTRALINMLKTSDTREQIEEVTLIYSMNRGEAEHTSILSLSNAIGHLPNLKTLRLSPSGFCTIAERDRSLQYLSRLILPATKLEALYCRYSRLDGTTQEFLDFAEGFSNLPRLKKVHFQDCRISLGQDTASNMNPFFLALSKVPKLCVCKLRLSSLFPPSSSAISNEYHTTFRLIERVLRKLAIQDATIDDLMCRGQHGKMVAAALATNMSLSRLEITSVEMREDEIQNLATIVRQSRRLETLVLALTCTQENVDDTHMAPLFEALAGNETIRNVTFHLEPFNQRHLLLDYNISNAIVAVLEKGNFTLRRATVTDLITSCFPHIKRKMEHYLKLNRLNRKYLSQSAKATREDLVKSLINAGDDLAVRYDLLSLNPSLYSTCNQGTASSEGKGYERLQKVDESLLVLTTVVELGLLSLVVGLL